MKTSEMSDRKLLELAAKAVGIKGHFGNDGKDAGLFLHDPERPSVWKRWHPLTDDGDALQLAVKLGIYFMVVREQGHVSARVRNGNRTAFNEPISSDEMAATRRAIVRAAAEIGQGQPTSQQIALDQAMTSHGKAQSERALHSAPKFLDTDQSQQ